MLNESYHRFKQQQKLFDGPILSYGPNYSGAQTARIRPAPLIEEKNSMKGKKTFKNVKPKLYQQNNCVPRLADTDTFQSEHVR